MIFLLMLHYRNTIIDIRILITTKLDKISKDKKKEAE